MPKARRKENPKSIGRHRVAQAVFAAGESMGISDRKLLERFTEQVSQRLEVAHPFPGMEELVPRQTKQSVSSSRIREMVQEMVTVDEFSPQARSQVISGIELSDNALRVLERRYLTKDGEGRVVETPQELFHRVAKHIASAEPN
jgi:ribonucleotide reductase alpha subunit